MKIVNWIVAFLMSITIGIVATVAIINYVSSDYRWYSREYDKYNICETMNTEKTELGKATEKMVGYLKGSEENLDVEVVVDGQTREFFNDREKAHMEDVKAIYNKLAKIRNYCMVIAIGGGVYFTFAKRGSGVKYADYAPKAFGITGLVFLVAMVIAFIALKTNFGSLFTVFHEKLFTNDLWLLDPSTDLLINMLPEGFFMDTALRIGKYLLICYVVMTAMYVVMASIRDTYQEGYARALEEYERKNGKIPEKNKRR